MRIRWWQRRTVPGPGTGRDERGRLHDGDRVRPEGWTGWHDLLPGRVLNEPTQLLPRPPTLAQRFRANGGHR